MSRQSDIKEGLIQITKSKPMAYQLLRFLVDNNCVLKVARELPEVPITSNSSAEFVPPYSQGYAQCRQDMAGYEAVESLIEVESDIDG